MGTLPTPVRPETGLLHIPPQARRRHPDRGREGLGLPALRTVHAVLPHTALQSVVSTSWLARVMPGCCQGEQPSLREEPVGPAAVVTPLPTHPRPLFLFAQHRP